MKFLFHFVGSSPRIRLRPVGGRRRGPIPDCHSRADGNPVFKDTVTRLKNTYTLTSNESLAIANITTQLLSLVCATGFPSARE